MPPLSLTENIIPMLSYNQRGDSKKSKQNQ